MTASEPPTPPPEGELIRIAREAMAISAETAAERTPIRLQGSRWRHIERGWERTRPELKTVHAPARTLAQMARTVGITPERLTEAGRDDAAKILREIQRQGGAGTAEAAERARIAAIQPDPNDPDEMAAWRMQNAPDEIRRGMIDILRRGKQRAIEEERSRRTG